MNALQDKIALVTGSSRGIGAGIARTAAENGAFVILHGQDQDPLAAAPSASAGFMTCCATHFHVDCDWSTVREALAQLRSQEPRDQRFELIAAIQRAMLAG